MDALKAPVKVSPTIKFVRWSLLFWGIIYGWNKKAVLEYRDKKDRILRHEALERKNILMKEKNELMNKELLKLFEGIFNVKLPTDW